MQDSNPNSAPRAQRRDGRTALIILAVVGTALLLGYHSTPLPAVPAKPAVVEAAPAPSPVYDLNTAMLLAGQQVPEERESYYFFAFVEDVPAEQEIADLTLKLQQASQEKDFLGIAGPDAERNRRNLLAALAASTGKDLAGAVIIYVGPAAQEEELRTAVQAAGAQFRFVSYPATAPLIQPAV